jgi:glutamate formiminotransferase
VRRDGDPRAREEREPTVSRNANADGREIVECVPNFSEGRRPEVVDAVVAAIEKAGGVRVLDREMDVNHNRAVVTFAGTIPEVEQAAFAGVAAARERIDLNHHQGEHPRMGATDVLPFVPVRGTTMEACIALARRVGRRVGNELEIPVFFYEEAATRPERRDLAKVREGQFEGLREAIGKDPARHPDFGPPRIHPTAGAIAIGARFFLVAYNVNLKSDDVKLAKSIAKQIRERDGGLKCVKALGFFLEDKKLAQVSMNLTNYTVTPIEKVYGEIERLAKAAGVEIQESELIGLAPRAAMSDDVARRVKLAGFDPKKQVLEELLAR